MSVEAAQTMDDLGDAVMVEAARIRDEREKHSPANRVIWPDDIATAAVTVMKGDHFGAARVLENIAVKPRRFALGDGKGGKEFHSADAMPHHHWAVICAIKIVAEHDNKGMLGRMNAIRTPDAGSVGKTAANAMIHGVTSVPVEFRDDWIVLAISNLIHRLDQAGMWTGAMSVLGVDADEATNAALNAAATLENAKLPTHD